MIIAALMAASLSGAQTTDIPPESMADVQCMAVLAVAIDRPDISETLKQQFSGGMMYYMGRLEGRDPRTNWVQRMLAYADATPLDEVNAHATRCGGELVAKGQEIMAQLDR